MLYAEKPTSTCVTVAIQLKNFYEFVNDDDAILAYNEIKKLNSED